MRTWLLLPALLAASSCAPQYQENYAPQIQASYAAPAQANRRVRIINESSRTILEFHASNIGRSTYEEDMLGNRVLAPGQSVVANIDDGTGACRFDFLTVMAGGQRIERRDVNVCQIEVYRITD